MKHTNILFALKESQYNDLDLLIGSDYSWSENLTNQESVINAIPSFETDYLLIYKELPGSRSFQEFYMLLVNSYPDLHIVIVEQDVSIVPYYINGEREIPKMHFEEIAATKEEAQLADQKNDSDQIVDQQNEEEITLSNASTPVRKKEKKWKFINKKEKEEWWEKEEKEKVQQNWELATKTQIELHAYLQKVISICSSSGGVGKTEIAINFAVHAANQGFKTCLLDFNLQNDDIAGRLGLDYKRGKSLVTAFDLYAQKQLHYEVLEDILQKFEKVDVLVGVKKSINSDEMNEDFFTEMIKCLKPHYDLIVIDCENNSYSPAYWPCLKSCDNILVPCTSHFSVLDKTRSDIHEWKDIEDIPLSKVDIVLNKANEGGFVNENQIIQNTSREVIAVIPYSKEMFLGAEREVPVVLRHSIHALKIKREFDKIIYRYTGKKVKFKSTLKPSITIWKKGMKNYAKKLNKK